MKPELTSDEVDRLLAFEKVRMLGHNLYVRKCQVPDLTDEQGKVLIALPEWTKENTCWAEILKVGPDVGMKPSKKRVKRLGRHLWLHWEPKPGDLVLLPEVAGNNLKWREPLGRIDSPSDLVVDESNVILQLPKENIDEHIGHRSG